MQPVPSNHACSIVPPYMLEALATHGDARQREAAVTTLAVDHTHRTRRAIAAASLVGTRHELPTHTGAAPQPHRSVFDAQHSEQLPGSLARAEGAAPVLDGSVNRAYDGLGATFTFYRDVLDRDSIDGRGMPMIASVHVGQRWDNAQWDGSQMQFGDGDGQIFGDFTASLDVIGHELTHGVTQYEAQLAYHGQSGALNESMSDVFGVLVKQHALGQRTEQADWLIGAELMLPGFHGTALRSMKAPGTAYDDPRLGGKDPQPATMAGYLHTRLDNGGVHLNSGIPNHAFYLVAAALGGQAWDVAGHIWYAALTDPALRPTASFSSFASATVRAARHGYGGAEIAAVTQAWKAVGVRVRGVRTP
jgi:Zn-dependent metalloprotease